ncbi:hypothetical protein CBER1_00453 [Cercospora berteroae]|uniref:Glucose-methanol-choline oxidoreductase C-terminal domain-containing protein n=1 Tax=Cercospora berteroae TaxID=357750 RepID=A0A2S6CBA9_9PEZI|nr:hypothetical protein CBER1_00453 [Cercospora berteroae]
MFSTAIVIPFLCCFKFSSFVYAEEHDAPDFSSFQYPGAPRIRSQPEYDFCIIGGGTAGLTLANRLTDPPPTSSMTFASSTRNNKIPADELRAIGAGAIVDAGWADQAHNEILYESVWYPQSFTEYGQPQQNTSVFSVTVSNLAALSQGSVRLGSSFALSDPVIDPNYLAEEADRAMAIQGVKYLRQVAAHPALQQWSAGEVLPGPQYQSDEELLEYARLHMIPNWHASNTCRMLPPENGGVVDSHMRVYGTKRLRVCDVSIFGRLPDVNLVGPVYAVAELGAEIIRKEYDDWTEDEH